MKKNSQKINEYIRARLVRVVLPDGKQLGVITTIEALKKVKELNLDLVEISPQANPPVCKILDFGKYRYELSKKQKDSKKASTMVVKTVQFTPNTGENDLLRKAAEIKKFLEKGFQVNAVIAMKGRQNAHPEVAYKQMDKVVESVGSAPSEKPKKQDSKILAIFKPNSESPE